MVAPHFPQVGLLPRLQFGGALLGCAEKIAGLGCGEYLVGQNSQCRQLLSTPVRGTKRHGCLLVPAEDTAGVAKCGEAGEAVFKADVGGHGVSVGKDG